MAQSDRDTIAIPLGHELRMHAICAILRVHRGHSSTNSYSKSLCRGGNTRREILPTDQQLCLRSE